MAANRRKTIEYAFPTRITTLATNTTLGTATRYDTSSLTVYIPETTSRNFLSVRLVATYHTEYTANNAIVGWRMGIQAGAGATVDTDRNISSVNANLKNVHDVVDQDVTAYFNANFGAGVSQSVVASLAAATTVATNINNITFRLVITYEFDATAHNTRAKTIRIPIQSQIGTITTAQQEIGTDSTNPAPANQIPALDTFLPEGTKVYRQVFLELTANTASGAATNFTTFLQLDNAGEVTRATINEALGATAKPWVDIWDITGLITTNAAHALKARCDLTNRMTSIGGVLHVTYEYSVSATVGNLLMCEAVVPLTPSDNDSGKIALNESFNANVAGDAGVLVALLDVQEAAPTLVQSGVILNLQNDVGQQAPTLRASGQPYRTYFTTSGGSGIGSQPVTHRCDQNSGWTLARGANRLPLDVYGVALQARGDFSGFAIINYTATCPADPDATNHPVNYLGAAYSTSFLQTVDVATGVARVPVLGSPYKISGVLVESFLRVSLLGGQTPSGQLFLAQLAGEWDARGFVVGPLQWRPGGGVQSFRQFSPFTRAFNADSFHTGKLNIETDRRVVYYDTTAENHFSSWNWWITYHQMTFTVAGILKINAVVAPNGKTIKVWAYNADGSAELVTTGVTAGGAGAFSIAVPDNTRTYFCTHQNVPTSDFGASQATAPGGVFDITIGGLLVTPPVYTGTTTDEAIRDRCIALIKAITPKKLVNVAFKPFLNDRRGEFRRQMEAQPEGSLRRYQVRATGADIAEAVSNTDVVEDYVTLIILVAYPQTNLAGGNNALDRDDLLTLDRYLILQQVGMDGYANFAGPAPIPNATWKPDGYSVKRIEGDGVDFLEIVETFAFYRSRA